MSRPAQFDRKLAAIFQAEAEGHVQRMRECLSQLEHGDTQKPVEQLFRAAHSLKGAARAVGEDEVEVACHAAEGLLSSLQRGRLSWSAPMGDVLHDLVSALARVLSEGPAASGSLVALLPRLEGLERADGARPPRPAPGPALPVRPPPAALEQEHTVRIGVDRLDGLLHGVEELLKAKLDAASRVGQWQEALASAASLRAAAQRAGGELRAAWEEHEKRLRTLAVAGARDQRQLAAGVDGLLAQVKQSLLLPVDSLRPFLVAAVRELARSQEKEVELRLRGDEVEMDRRLLEELREPLLHLARNAVGHGIETPAERKAAGKPARAVLDILIQARAGRAEITVSDDGRGIATAPLADAARALGVPVQEDAEPGELLHLIFAHGVSTATQLTAVAGRGIGLAIVRETVERMGGTVSVASRPGEGTTFRLSLATSLSTHGAVEVRASGQVFLLPTSSVNCCRRFTNDQVRSVGAHAVVTVGEQDLPLATLASVLGLPPRDAATSALDCVVVGAGQRQVALAVDEIGGEHEVLGKPVDSQHAHSPVLSGAASLGALDVVPILNVPELVRIALREAGRRPEGQWSAAARPQGCSVLLAEDSITSRTLLKNILELAGHRVDTAVDGAEALRKLHEGSYDIVVSDVEMPNLDGIDLTRAIRSDAVLARLPVVLVTSLSSPGDRERGAEAGANAYIVKSSFDQGRLLQAIAELA